VFFCRQAPSLIDDEQTNLEIGTRNPPPPPLQHAVGALDVALSHRQLGAHPPTLARVAHAARRQAARGAAGRAGVSLSAAGVPTTGASGSGSVSGSVSGSGRARASGNSVFGGGTRAAQQQQQQQRTHRTCFDDDGCGGDDGTQQQHPSATDAARAAGIGALFLDHNGLRSLPPAPEAGARGAAAEADQPTAVYLDHNELMTLDLGSALFRRSATVSAASNAIAAVHAGGLPTVLRVLNLNHNEIKDLGFLGGALDPTRGGGRCVFFDFFFFFLIFFLIF
jgi:hypothetical protein